MNFMKQVYINMRITKLSNIEFNDIKLSEEEYIKKYSSYT
jgi:hypothetical protein